MADVWNGHLLRFVLLFALAYTLGATITDAPLLIRLLNGVAMSTAAGVCVAYAPILGALISSAPSKGEYLGAGIFFFSMSIIVRSGLSVIARDFGWPEIYNTNFTSFAMAVGILGSLLHLWAPNAVEGRVPRARWISTGVIVAIGCFVAFCAWLAHTGVGPHPPVELK